MGFSSEFDRSAQAEFVVVDAASNAPVQVPDQIFLQADFKRAGSDLVMKADGDRQLVVLGYFNGDKRAALIGPDGSTIPGDFVEKLAGHDAPGQFAQADTAAGAPPIGRLDQVSGYVTVTHANGVTVEVHAGDVVAKDDVIQTANGASLIVSFRDGTALELGSATRMILNDFAYSPNSTVNGATLSVVQGSFAFVAGEVAHTGGLSISTPCATLGIRGTVGGGSVGNGCDFFASTDIDGKPSTYALTDAAGVVTYGLVKVGSPVHVVVSGDNQPPIIITMPSPGAPSDQTLTTSQALAEQLLNAYPRIADNLFNPIALPDLTELLQGLRGSGGLVETFFDGRSYLIPRSMDSILPFVPTTFFLTVPGNGSGSIFNTISITIETPVAPAPVLPFAVNTAPSFIIAPESSFLPIAADALPADASDTGLSVSGDGRYIAVDVSSLLPGQTPATGTGDVVLFDRVSGAVTSLTIAHIDQAPSGEHYGKPSISSDGGVVAFQGTSSPAGGPPAQSVIYLYDRATDQTSLLTDPTTGDPIIGTSPHLSANCSFLAIENSANGINHLVLADRNGTTLGDISADQPITAGDISANGRFVTFSTIASQFNVSSLENSDLTIDKAGPAAGLYVFDRAENTVRPLGYLDDAAGRSAGGAMSAEGRAVVFSSDLVDPNNPFGPKGNWNIFVYDQTLNTLKQISVGDDGNAPDGDSYSPRISLDGTKVTFVSLASNLDPSAQDGQPRGFIYDLQAGTLESLPTAVGALGTVTGEAGASLNLDGSLAVFAATVTPAGGVATPIISLVDRSGGTEGTVAVDNSSTLTTNGTLFFTDPDGGDTHQTEVTAGAGALGVLTATIGQESGGAALPGVVQWDYQLAASSVNLAPGETHTDTFEIKLTDSAGGTTTQTVKVTVIGPTVSVAQPIFWTTGFGGSFADGADWSALAVPGVGASVLIDHVGTYTVLSASNETIGTLRIIPTATLAIEQSIFKITSGHGLQNDGTIGIGQAGTLQLGGAVHNTGEIELNAVSGTAILKLDTANSTFDGGGRVTLSDISDSRITGTSATATLTNIDNTISGGGSIKNLILINQGELDATSNRKAFLIDSGSNAVTNDGKMLATGTKGFTVNSSLLNHGTIALENRSSFTEVGTLSNLGTAPDVSDPGSPRSGGIEVHDRGFFFASTLVNGPGMAISADGSGAVAGTTLQNDGSIDLSDGAFFDFTSVANSGSVTADGASSLLVGSFENDIQGQLVVESSAELTDDEIINFGSYLVTDSASAEDTSFINKATGALGVEGGAVVKQHSVQNAGSINVHESGSYQAEHLSNTEQGSILLVDSATATLTDSTNLGVIAAADTSQLTLEGTIENAGVIELDQTAHIEIQSHVSLNGGGEVSLHGTDSPAGDPVTAITGSSDQSVLENIDNTISGGGNIGLGHLVLINRAAGSIISDQGLTIDTGLNPILNEGLIETGAFGLSIASEIENSGDIVAAAPVSGISVYDKLDNFGHVTAAGAFSLVNLFSDIINSGTISADGARSTILLQHLAVANAGGVLDAQAGQIVLGNASVTGGALNTSSAGSIVSGFGNNRLQDIVLNGALFVTSSSDNILGESQSMTVTLNGGIDNEGLISVFAGPGFTEKIAIAGTVTLNGSGRLSLLGSPFSSTAGGAFVVPVLGPATLRNVSNTIVGEGSIGGDPTNGLTLINEAGGTIIADLPVVSGTDVPTQGLRLGFSQDHIVNSGLIEAEDGGVVRIGAGILNDGDLFADNGSIQISQSATGAGRATVNNGSLVYSALTTLATRFTAGGSGNLAINDTTLFSGKISNFALGDTINLGLVPFDGVSSMTYVENSDHLGGTLEIRSSFNNANLNLVGSYQTSDFSLVKVGSFNTVVTLAGQNHWTNGTDGAFDDSSRWSAGQKPQPGDDALIDAPGSYTVTTTTSTTVNSLQLAKNASLVVAGGPFTVLHGSRYDNLDGVLVVKDGQQLKLGGSIEIDGTVRLSSSGANTTLTIVNDATFETAAGSAVSSHGQLTLSDDPHNIVEGASPATQLINVNTRISGAGQLGHGQLTLINHTGGVIDATGVNALIIDTGGSVLINEGTLQASGSGGLIIQNTTVNNAASLRGGSITTGNSGQVTLQDATIEGGQLGQITSVLIARGEVVVDGSAGHAVSIVGSLQVQDGQQLTLRGAIETLHVVFLPSIVDGIVLSSAGHRTALLIDQDGATLSEGGNVFLGGSGDNVITGALPDALLDNVDNKIFGSGEVGGGHLRLFNEFSGKILASVAGTTLVVDTGSEVLENQGLLSATAGTLIIQDTTVDNFGGGQISAAAGSEVSLDHATILGGTLAGTIQAVNSSTLDGSDFPGLTVAGTVQVGDGEELLVRGTLDGASTGSIALGSTGTDTTLRIGSSSVQLVDGLSITLSDDQHNRIVSNSSGATVENVDGTITGAGQIGDGHLHLINRAGGTISATGANALVIDAGEDFTNEGVVEAVGTGGLVLEDTTVVSTPDAVIEVGPTSHVDLKNAQIHGGVLRAETPGQGLIQTAGGANVISGASDNPAEIAATVRINDGDQLALQGVVETLSGAGSIALAGASQATTLSIDGDVQLVTPNAPASGQPTVILSDDDHNVITNAGADATLELVGQHVSGAGRIAGSLTVTIDENSSIDATGAHALVIDTPGHVVENAGKLKADGAGGLIVQDTTIQNVNGTMSVGSGSHIELQRAVIVGGELDAAGPSPQSAVRVTDGQSGLDGRGGHALSTSVTIDVADGASLFLRGTVKNSGVISLDSSGSATTLDVDDTNLALQGGGEIQLSDDAGNVVTGSSANAFLDNKDNTISGAGRFGNGVLKFKNESGGTVKATGRQALIVETGSGPLINDGLLVAASAGGLVLQDTALGNSGGGTLSALAGSHVDLQGSSVTGGALSTIGDGTIRVGPGGGTLADLSTSADVVVTNGQTLTLSGLINNNKGTIELAATSAVTTLTIANANVTLAGNGDITLSDSSQNVVSGQSPNATLTNADNVISGAGQIGGGHLTLINELGGVIKATGAHALVLDTGGHIVLNAGTIEAIGSGGLVVQDSTIDSSGGGSIKSFLGSHIDLQDATLVGGTLTADDGSLVRALGVSGFEDLSTQAFVLVSDGDTLTLGGIITNTGTLQLNSTGGPAALLVHGPSVTLEGLGDVTLSDDGHNSIASDGAMATLTNLGNVISGAGHVGDADLTLINRQGGLIDATGTHPLVLDTQANEIVNEGILEATNSGGLTIQSSVLNTSGLIEANGGDVSIFADVTGGNAAIVTANLEFGGAATTDVEFLSPTGALILDQPSQFDGHIKGFTAQDAVDLAGIGFSNALSMQYAAADPANTAGTLTVSDGVHSAELQFEGQYVLGNFKASDDGRGGTIIVDPPVESPALSAVPESTAVMPAVSSDDDNAALHHEGLSVAAKASGRMSLADFSRKFMAETADVAPSTTDPDVALSDALDDGHSADGHNHSAAWNALHIGPDGADSGPDRLADGSHDIDPTFASLKGTMTLDLSSAYSGQSHGFGAERGAGAAATDVLTQAQVVYAPGRMDRTTDKVAAGDSHHVGAYSSAEFMVSTGSHTEAAGAHQTDIASAGAQDVTAVSPWEKPALDAFKFTPVAAWETPYTAKATLQLDVLPRAEDLGWHDYFATDNNHDSILPPIQVIPHVHTNELH